MKTNFLCFRNFAKSALMLLLFSIPILGQIRSDTGSNVSGTLTMTDGKVKKEIPLKYVYSTYVLSGAGLQIVLSDKPLPETYEERHRYIEVLSNEGRFNGLVIQIDTKSKKVEGSTVYSELSLDPSSGTTQAWGSSDARKQVFEPKVMNAKTVTGTLYSNSILGGNNAKDSFQYRATFTVKVETNGFAFQEGKNDEPNKAYLNFYKAVQAGDLQKVKKLIAADYVDVFEGAKGQTKLSMLKSFIKVFSAVHHSNIYPGGKSATLDAENPRFEEELKKLGLSRSRPPDPSIPREKIPKELVEVRLVLEVEEGQWKVFWVLDGDLQANILAENYKTLKELEAATGEERWELDNAKPLPAGGGDAGKAYLEFCSAEKSGDKKMLLKYLTGEQYTLYSSPDMSISKGVWIWKESSAADYTNLTVTGGMSNGKKAVLKVQALKKGARTIGNVSLVLEGGQWKVDFEDWEN